MGSTPTLPDPPVPLSPHASVQFYSGTQLDPAKSQQTAPKSSARKTKTWGHLYHPTQSLFKVLTR
jgi:hypothetical protein